MRKILKLKNIILALIMIFVLAVLPPARRNKKPLPHRAHHIAIASKNTNSTIQCHNPCFHAPQTSNFPACLLIYPGGAFQLSVPEGWDQEISEYGSAFLSEPDGEGAIYITVTNTGYAIGSDAFDRFLDAREENFFAGFSGYRGNFPGNQ